MCVLKCSTGEIVKKIYTKYSSAGVKQQEHHVIARANNRVRGVCGVGELEEESHPKKYSTINSSCSNTRMLCFVVAPIIKSLRVLRTILLCLVYLFLTLLCLLVAAASTTLNNPELQMPLVRVFGSQTPHVCTALSIVSVCTHVGRSISPPLHRMRCLPCCRQTDSSGNLPALLEYKCIPLKTNGQLPPFWRSRRENVVVGRLVGAPW